MTTRQVLSVPA